MRFAHNLEFEIRIWNFAPKAFRSTANSEVSRELRYAVKTLESKETRASKEIRVTHNSVFAAHRLQCRMTNRKNRHPAFCFLRSARGSRAGVRWFAETNFKSAKADRFGYTRYPLFLNPRDMSGGKLPTTIALDQRVCELHDSIERFAVRRSFHARFSENDCRVTVKPR
jgi:hypothetical protein